MAFEGCIQAEGRFLQTRPQGTGMGIVAQVLEISDQCLMGLGRAAQHQVRPGPGFAVFGGVHLLHVGQLLEPVQIELGFTA